ncbi:MULTISPECIES: PRD domain-containing protein [Enterococcus]|uniref:PRD domain-containing protein n=1 Tax=Enterococcus TaxID=1350 RepID=UPI00189E4A04|nr:PRD domain-containing protein [Enterococcus dispar]MCU7357978.1 PRD domain-containing protein [Enterococcus dispar]MDT2705481.1 PRD domain-containing protein [Enterococcus dispar]WCG32717.1 PRD domain-containing protein [Enterococcus dispar]
MYRIIQVLNNNVAIIRIENDEQAIAMGKGIVFQKKKGDLLKKEEISKLFMLRNKESQQNFSSLLKDLPLNFITTGYEVIDTAVRKFNYPVQEYIYVTLTDHIYWSYQNQQKGCYEMSRLPDMSKEYPTEYAIGKMAITIINNRLNTNFPDDEIGRIALHFINAKREGEATEEVVDPRQDIVKLVEKVLNQKNIHRTEENKNFYDRLMIHLNYFADRLNQPEEQVIFSKNLETNIKTDYPNAYEIGHEIYQLISDYAGRKLSDSERVYLAIHIQRLLRKKV